MNVAADRLLRGVMDFLRRSRGAGAQMAAESLEVALQLLDEPVATAVPSPRSAQATRAARVRWEHRRSMLGASPEHDALSLSTDLKISESREAPLQQMLDYDHAGALGGIVHADDPMPDELAKVATLPEVHVTDVRACWRKFCGHYAGQRPKPSIAGRWQKWLLDERAPLAPPQSETRIRAAPDIAEREREQYAEHQRLRREAAPPPQTFRDVLQRLAKGRPPDHAARTASE